MISGVKSLSDKAMASAVAGFELATEVEASLRRAEEHFGNHLDEATDKQVNVTANGVTSLLTTRGCKHLRKKHTLACRLLSSYEYIACEYDASVNVFLGKNLESQRVDVVESVL